MEPERREGQTWHKVFKVFTRALSGSLLLMCQCDPDACSSWVVMMINSGSGSVCHAEGGRANSDLQSPTTGFLMEQEPKPPPVLTGSVTSSLTTDFNT